jgi:hypothetical protein
MPSRGIDWDLALKKKRCNGCRWWDGGRREGAEADNQKAEFYLKKLMRKKNK